MPSYLSLRGWALNPPSCHHQTERDENGAGALLHAAMGGGVSVIRFLENQGIDLHDIDTNEMNALLYAAYAGAISSFPPTYLIIF